jgi:exodeoxyribonuclease VII small subunit
MSFDTDAAQAADPSDPRLSQVLARLDEIRTQLDSEDLDLEDQLVLYREGCTLVATAKRILSAVRAEVDILMHETDALPTRGN